MYSVIWKYKVKGGSEQRFEKEYGAEGTWNELFRLSQYYIGSYLYKSEEELDVYLLIDSWTDKKSYEDFKRAFADIYIKLSKRFSDLYESEVRIGAFIPA